jgi:hypothetical protein
LAALIFSLVVVLRASPQAKGGRDALASLRRFPTDLRPGWKLDPAGTPDHVRYWDGSRWAVDSTPGDAAEASGWRPPRVRYSPSSVIRAVAISILVPLIALTPVVTLIALAITRIHTNINMGGSNK